MTGKKKHKKKQEIVRANSLCSKCGKNEATAPHRCPFQSEINDNDDSEFCTCCEACESECAWDI